MNIDYRTTESQTYPDSAPYSKKTGTPKLGEQRLQIKALKGCDASISATPKSMHMHHPRASFLSVQATHEQPQR
ncbi:hypothetical protein EAF00_010936 [Botryotinia globosa]|nr:hypothetical protein EAF00_010936 [Botryotinia globosa]